MRLTAILLTATCGWFCASAPAAAAPLAIDPPSTGVYGWADNEARAFSLSLPRGSSTYTLWIEGIGTSHYSSLASCCTDVFGRVLDLYPGGTLHFSRLAINSMPTNTEFWDDLNLTVLSRAALDNLGTLTGVVTLPLKKVALEGMESLPKIGLALLATSALLAAAQAVGRRRGEGGRTLEEMRFSDAALIGAFQSLSALFRGLSRSGNTIAMGLFTGLSRRAAAEDSFLLSAPTILSAALVENASEYRASGHLFTEGSHLGVYLAGMAAAAVVGYAAVALLLRLVVAMKLQTFVLYCALLGAVVLAAGLS